MTGLLDSSEPTLTAALWLKSGAMDLLATLKSMGNEIILITEGPQDAHERTVKALGIGGYIDFLITTKYFPVSKGEDLFS